MRGEPKPVGHLNTERSFSEGDGETIGGEKREAGKERGIHKDGRGEVRQLSKAKRPKENWKWKERHLKRSRRWRVSGREKMTGFQTHNEDTAAVFTAEVLSPPFARSSWAPLTSWRSTSPLHRLQLAPSRPAGPPCTLSSPP